MTQPKLKSLAHPDWPYEGTPHEWRGFVKNDQIKPPKGYRWADPVKAAKEMHRPGGIIEIVPIYQKQNFGPELP